MSAVLVTGGGGFVGSAVVRRLVLSGAELWDGAAVEHVVALLPTAAPADRLEPLRGRGSWSLERLDLRDRGGLAGLLRRLRPRAVVHAALDPAVFAGAPVGYGMLETLFDGLFEAGDARLVHTGSAWTLAPGERLDETAPLDPRSPYARYKAGEDALLPGLGERAGVPWIELRLFNVFGRYERPSRLLPHLVARLSRGEPAAVSHGEQVRDFNDVDEIAEAFAFALRAPGAACGTVYHVGSGRPTTVREFASTVARALGRPELVRFGAGETSDQDLPALVADPARARRVLGWRPGRDLDARIRAAVEWWLARLAQPAASRPRPEEAVR